MKRSLLLFLVVVSLFLAACGGGSAPAPAQSSQPQAPKAQAPIFMLALPRVVVDLDAQGNPSVMGIKLADVGALTGQDLSGLRMDKATQDKLMAAGVQNVEVRQSGNGLEWLIDGRLMPSIGWDDASLANAGKLAALAGQQNWQTISRLLPIVRRLGVDVAFKLPRPAGVAEIPLGSTGRISQTVTTTNTQPSAVLQAEISFDQNGVPSIMGISAADLATLGINVPAALSPDTIQKLQAQNIQSLEIVTKPEGLTVYVNNDPVPNLTWDQETLQNLIDFYLRMDTTNPLAPAIKQAAPFIRNANIHILMHFPVAQGQTAIPVQLH